ncbi:MAG: LacI family DNA-binding transcriptional regulator [Burkholderiales bacterium]|nr:LacI family DNA-binding transcriptional regulator [Burkholderiales bacterium]MDE1928785.1 LacI family DNA-binding transcriptional regulator [Burkholderiales bacterium]MDE2160699.1 LacI family DNA-binding transcriptional regulator [Burkholderiales bacterium]
MSDPNPPPAAAGPVPPSRQARRGHGRITLQDVAEVAGVTSITVSRYLRDPAVVAADTAARVRDALAQTGYVPNKQAGLLASGRSNIVAALLPNLSNSIFAETAQGLSDGLQAAGFELLIASTGYSLEREEHQLRALLGWHPAALVVTGRRHAGGALQLLAAAQAAAMPVIEIWDHAGAERGQRRYRHTQIGFNHHEVGRAMAAHLMQAGHRRLAYVDSGVAEDYRAHERGLAFADAARAGGAQVTVLTAPAGDAFDAGRQVLGELAPGGARRPTAAAFANDHLACGALLEAARRGLPVPAQLALLGFGDFSISRQLSPALSSVQLPRYEIGRETARSLLDALRLGKPAVSVALPWTLAARASTAPA